MYGPLAAIQLCFGALLLRSEAYEDMRDLPSPFTKGLVLILVVGLAVSVVAIVGETLEWATTPDLVAIKEAMYEGLRETDWYQERAGTEGFAVAVRQQYEWVWRFLPYVLPAPSPVSAGVKVVTTPLWWEVSWLVFGLLGYLSARLLGGQGTLAQTLGCTALAVAPRLLGLAAIFPYVQLGGVISIWALICNYLALKAAQRLSSTRAFWATLLPFIIVVLLVVGLVAGTGIGLELILPEGSW
jgi:hypothetical protein